MGGIHGGDYRLYRHYAGGGMVAMDEACVARMRSDAGKRGASPDANVNISGLIRSQMGSAQRQVRGKQTTSVRQAML